MGTLPDVDAHNVNLNFNKPLDVVDAHNVVLGFGDGEVGTQYITTDLFDSLEFGACTVKSSIAKLYATGFDSFAYGEHKLIQSQFIAPTGFDVAEYGNQEIINKNQTIQNDGFDSFEFTNLEIHNFKQYIQNDGLDSFQCGEVYLIGGVKYIEAIGIDSNIFDTATVINTKAEQYIDIGGEGIEPPPPPSPNVSPWILYPTGFKADGYGQPLVQRNPSPDGFINSSYGNAWVSHSPRYLLAGIGDSFISGYPQVFDPTRTIYLADKGIEGGIFGDTAVKNTRRIIAANGFQSSQFSSFATIYSNRRYLPINGFDASKIGINAIYNKTPSLAPTGFDSLQGLNFSIGYAIRHIYPPGFDLLNIGNAAINKPPEIKPNGFNTQSFGELFISNYTRSIEVAGISSQKFGDPTTWHKIRRVQTEGFVSDLYGEPRIEHERRSLLALGDTHSLYGQPWLSYAVRSIAVESIYTEFASNHKVGGLQFIDAQGFIATQFGTRIIPEVQSLAPFGFSNSYGIATIDLSTKYVTPQGFKTTTQESLRFGSPKFYNLAQYIVQNFDGDSGLVPPQWSQWTLIENRNKAIGAIGNNFAKVGEPNLYNNARLIKPIGFDSFKDSGLLIADRIRHLRLDGIEPIYISGWSNVHNDAQVIQGFGFGAQLFGNAAIENTRRYYPRVGNWESLEFGVPMIADAIRTIDIESRYGISPPYISMPDIHLYRRYLDEVGKDDHLRMGEPSLSIHFNIIAPRWAHTDRFGEPRLMNVTPEVHAYGHNSELFGNASLRTSFRVVQPVGSLMELFSLTGIADRDRAIGVNGINAGAIGSALKVTKTGAPPYSLQYIWLDRLDEVGGFGDGQGINPPDKQVGTPFLSTNVIVAIGFSSESMGKPAAHSNGIIVKPGIQEYGIGTPNVTLKNRMTTVESISSTLAFGKPRISPHTIYATTQTPMQAINNHNNPIFTSLNSGNGTRDEGEVFGRLEISTQHRKLENVSLLDQSSIDSSHRIQLRRRYINLDGQGFRSQRTGFHVVGPFNQEIVQFESDDFSVFGSHAADNLYYGDLRIESQGIFATSFAVPSVELLHRAIKFDGFDAQEFGINAPADNPFMWQGIRIGERILGNYGGFDALSIGNTFISNRVRGVELIGFDAFLCEYDYTNFKDRMRVTKSVIEKPKQYIGAVGFVADDMGVLNIKPAAHYIRPDGNAEQYRKGAW